VVWLATVAARVLRGRAAAFSFAASLGLTTLRTSGATTTSKPWTFLERYPVPLGALFAGSPLLRRHKDRGGAVAVRADVVLSAVVSHEDLSSIWFRYSSGLLFLLVDIMIIVVVLILPALINDEKACATSISRLYPCRLSAEHPSDLRLERVVLRGSMVWTGQTQEEILLIVPEVARIQEDVCLQLGRKILSGHHAFHELLVKMFVLEEELLHPVPGLPGLHAPDEGLVVHVSLAGARPLELRGDFIEDLVDILQPGLRKLEK